jgi:hypothetical protein
MKPLPTGFQCILATVLLALAAGCASTKPTENLLTLAGFRPVAAQTARQQQQLEALPHDKVTRIQRKGKTYYIFPDLAHHLAYVGSPKEYRNYQQLSSDYQLSNGTLATAKVDEDEPSGWDGWDGMEVVVWSD